jgi:hypothetical protein
MAFAPSKVPESRYPMYSNWYVTTVMPTRTNVGLQEAQYSAEHELIRQQKSQCLHATCERKLKMIGTTTKSNPSNSVAAAFSQHSGAENAVKELKDGGFDVKKLSIIGSDYHSEENVVGFYNTGDRMMYWGKTGAF